MRPRVRIPSSPPASSICELGILSDPPSATFRVTCDPLGSRRIRIALPRADEGVPSPRLGFLPDFTCSRRRAVDQGRETSRKGDTAELQSVSVGRSAALAECDRLQSGQPVAVAGTASKDRQLVVDQLARGIVEKRRPLDQACRHDWQLLAESHLTRRLVGAMLAAGSRPCQRQRVREP